MKRLKLVTMLVCMLFMLSAFALIANAETYKAYSTYKTGKTTSYALIQKGSSETSDVLAQATVGTKFSLRGIMTNDDGSKWYKVVYNGDYGYISSKKVKVISNVGYTIYTPYKKGTATSNINARSGAGTGYSIRGTVKKGSTYTVYGYITVSGKKWYRIVFNGKSSYVLASYMKVQSQLGPSVSYAEVKTGITLGTTVNIRKNAGTSYDILGKISGDTKISLKGIRYSVDNFMWYKVTYNGSSGYISSSDVNITDDIGYVIYTPEKTGTITCDSLLVRAKASLSAETLGTIRKDVAVTLKGYKYDSEGTKWYRILYNGKAAYLKASCVDIVSSYPYTIYTPWKTAKVTGENINVNVRQKPDVSSKKLGSVETDTRLSLRGYIYVGDTKWYRITYNGDAAYISSKYVEIIGTYKYIVYTPHKAGLALADFKAYEDISVSSTVKDTIEKGANISVFGYVYDENNVKWYRISYDNKTTYAKAENIKLLPPYETYLANQGFPESYWPYLKKMHEAHPNWIFKAQKTGLSFSTVYNVETKVGKTLYEGNIAAWKSFEKGAYDFDNQKYVTFDSGTWVTAYPGLVKYSLDPRNFINESYIFMFLDQSFDSSSQSISTVKQVVKGTFMDASFPESSYSTYSSCIYYAAKAAGMNPNVLASMIREEQGVTLSSSLITGTYPGYTSLYNYLNIGAYRAGSLSAVERGLRYARGDYSTAYGQPWNTRAKAIKGGALFYASGYITNNQNTLYLKKYNVMNGSSNVGTHQYMSNVFGAIDEALIMKSSYSSMANEALSFCIPVFSNMDSSAYPLPGKEGNNNNLLKALSVAGYSLNSSFDMYDTSYSITVPSSVSSITVSATPRNSNATVSGMGKITLAKGTNTVKVVCTATSGATRTYTITVNRK